MRPKRDLTLWDRGDLRVFAVPQDKSEDLRFGQTVGIKEPFKKIMVTERFEKDEEIQEKKVLAGVMYRTDKKIKWMRDEPNQYEESPRWSPASQLPEYAIRRYAIISSMSDAKPIQDITDDELHLMCLDYPTQGDPQMLLEGYLAIKNFELLLHWWKEHYKATLKNNDSPIAILLGIQPA